MAAITPFIAPQATWDLRMARVDRSAAWRARQNAKPRRATARSVSLLALPGPSWDWVPVLSFTSAVFVCGIPEVRTRGTSSSAVPSPRPHATSWRCEPMFVLSICRRSVESAENKGAHRDEHASSLGAQVPALDGTCHTPNEWPSFPWFSPRHYTH